MNSKIAYRHDVTISALMFIRNVSHNAYRHYVNISALIFIRNVSTLL